jgi:hypothetical protein
MGVIRLGKKRYSGFFTVMFYDLPEQPKIPIFGQEMTLKQYAILAFFALKRKKEHRNLPKRTPKVSRAFLGVHTSTIVACLEPSF